MATGDPIRFIRIAKGLEAGSFYTTSRRATVKRLETISFQNWRRTAGHHEFGQATIVRQASYFVKHEHPHWPQLATIKGMLGR